MPSRGGQACTTRPPSRSLACRSGPHGPVCRSCGLAGTLRRFGVRELAPALFSDPLAGPIPVRWMSRSHRRGTLSSQFFVACESWGDTYSASCREQAPGKEKQRQAAALQNALTCRWKSRPGYGAAARSISLLFYFFWALACASSSSSVKRTLQMKDCSPLIQCP
jgi:hypothetical protein